MSGSTFTQVKFQVDSTATQNAMSRSTLHSLVPDAELKRSPYRLYPYGNPKPLEPEGQVDLVCERENKYETLTFQVLPDSSIGCKPALLLGSDSERLGLIKNPFPIFWGRKNQCWTRTFPRVPVLPSMGPPLPQVEQIPEPKMTMACNHLQQLHETTANLCNPSPSPSKPIQLLSKRHLPSPGRLRKEDILG